MHQAALTSLISVVPDLQLEESPVNPADVWLDDTTNKARISQICAIASDVDGTLLTTSEQTMHPRTKQAIQEAISRTFSPLNKLQWKNSEYNEVNEVLMDPLLFTCY